MTLHNNAYTSHFTKHIHCLKVVRVWMKKEVKTERKRYDLSISSVVSASVLLVHICSCSLHWALNHWKRLVWMFMSEFEQEEWVCYKTCVARLPTWKLINTANALTLCVYVCGRYVPACSSTLHSFHNSSRSCHLCSKWSFRELMLLIFQELVCLLT